MQITITIPQDLVDTVNRYALEFLGKYPTEDQLRGFFAADVDAMYCNIEQDQRSLREGVTAFFYAAE